MEAMENGSNTEPGSNHPINSEIHNPQGLNPGRGIRFKPLAVQNSVTLATSSTKHSMKSSHNLGSRVSNRYSSCANNGSNQEDDDEDGCLVETPIEETLNRTAYGGHKDGCLVETPIREAKNHKSSSTGGGIRNKSSITPQQESGRSGLRPRKFSKVIHDDEVDDNGGMWIKVPRNTNLFRGRHQNETNSNANGKDLNKGKKKNGGISEVVSSIKLLGDGFMKIEKMKIDMAREMEKMRMEAEMKRNQLILESQKQIVDAFVKGVIESRKQPTTMAHL